MVFVYNSIYDLNDYNPDLISTFIDNDLRRAGQLMFATKPYLPRNECYVNFLNNRVIKIWNNLPTEVRLTELSDLGYNSGFKNAVKDYYHNLLQDTFNVNSVCSWITWSRCVQCRI